MSASRPSGSVALRRAPRQSTSLYGRGVARQRKGDAEGGAADIAAAVKIKSDIARDMARYGLK